MRVNDDDNDILITNNKNDPDLVVKVKVTQLQDQTFLNNQIAKPVGLPTSNNYHVTIGIIKNVPTKDLQRVKTDIYKYLREQVYAIKSHPIIFSIKEATTYKIINYQYYSPDTIILLPVSASIFLYLNKALANYVNLHHSSALPIFLDTPTQPQHYLAHMTLGKTSTSHAIRQLNTILANYQKTHGHRASVKLPEYRISFQ